MVARARSCELGGEVGFHIGHSKVASASSKIVFKTAGVLLDELLDKGIAALRYKVIILDEVHERSVESDLVLACMKQFMLKDNNLRLVLMSATADISRYKEYFKDLGRGERVEVLAIPTLPQKTNFQRKVFYLEQVAELLGISSEPSSALCNTGLSHCSSNAEMKPEEHKLIHDLVMRIHEDESDIEKSILVFLPTYVALEQQWTLLKPLTSFKVHILHRSIDTDQALMSMKICKSHRKEHAWAKNLDASMNLDACWMKSVPCIILTIGFTSVILATNIAESSVTIPGVAFVIDSCRSLQVFWDQNRKKDTTKLVWVSKSQAEQRKGRTGRTCDGYIYRLVKSLFFNDLNEHERPAILNLSLRQQVLNICCAESRAINDPKALMQKALDPPDPEIVEDALSLLVHIHALEKPASQRGRYEPTFYGRLLASLSLSFDASVIILKFGEIGMLREGILIGVLADQLPLPILHPFGEQTLVCHDHVVSKMHEDPTRIPSKIPSYICLFFVTQYAEYLDKYYEGKTVAVSRKGVEIIGNLCAFQFWQRAFKDKLRLERLGQIVGVHQLKSTKPVMVKIEEEWCHFHNLLQTSLHHVSEIYEDVLNAVHRFRPKFLAMANGLPSYYEPYEFKHTCLLQSHPIVDTDALAKDDDLSLALSSCVALPFVASEQFQADVIAEKLEAIIKEGCRNGDSCFFSHDHDTITPIHERPTCCLPEDEVARADPFLRLLIPTEDGSILIIDDNDLHFSRSLSQHRNQTRIIATTSKPHSSSDAPTAGLTVLSSDPYHSIIANEEEIAIPWGEVLLVLWFAEFTVDDENFDVQHRRVQKFFEFLAVRILADTLYDVRVIITMNNSRFAHLQVERLGRECFFTLSESFPFDELTFGEFSKGNSTKKPMMASRPVSYVFDMQPPTDLQFGDYSSVLSKCLNINEKIIQKSNCADDAKWKSFHHTMRDLDVKAYDRSAAQVSGHVLGLTEQASKLQTACHEAKVLRLNLSTQLSWLASAAGLGNQNSGDLTVKLVSAKNPQLMLISKTPEAYQAIT
ncbi:hypothetical protein ACLOJK_026214 [Asimina triloba]